MNSYVSIWNYANRGEKARAVRIGKLTLYFSYETVIAFEDGFEFHIAQNRWGRTTGGHLNSINGDKSIREEQSEFRENLYKVLKKYGLSNNI